MKYFYKIENEKLQLGSGFKIPTGFIKYIKGEEPKELLDILNKDILSEAKQSKIVKLNNQRDKEVKNMVIEIIINGVKVPFNADEMSQIRLNRAVTTLQKDTDTVEWIDANGNIQTLTKADCLNCMIIAGQKQTELFINCAELKKQVKQASTLEYLQKI